MIPKRCPWCINNLLEQEYHDTQWGVPEYNDARLFEMLFLESMQAGLSWITILRKREAFRNAFDGFSHTIIAGYGEKKIGHLMQDSGIIRYEKKIRAAVKNAQVFMEIQQKCGSFSNYIWDFFDGEPVRNAWKTMEEVPAVTPVAETIAKELKKKGMGFLGPITVYAYMQAVGLVNDHLVSCFRYKEV